MKAYIPLAHPRQRGSVLIISLIMLVVLTLIGISMIRMTTTNLQLVNNMQGRHQALAAANDIVNQVLSSSFINPSDINGTLNAVAAASYTYSPEGEDASKKTYTVTVSKPCLKSLTFATDKITRIIQPQIRARIAAINTLLAANPPDDVRAELEAERTLLVQRHQQYQTCVDDKAPCYLTLWQFTATVSTGFLGAKTSLSAGTDVVLNSETGIQVRNDSALYCTS
ncbi:pilus assembly PilX family protein [Azospira restricta]|uniref:Pilus assembly PilX N-terminal domain-containing protein n=1 Tax=Azospira restricta TaxID=404405 RepID=A0A974PY18_9RHOO|nr:pilus assembly PilX N-terminal domain-containing protein [Azospira restricta]QRJ63421.1 pilus assembly PilX N-terminal domain-containing protein [Azospira restricta]